MCVGTGAAAGDSLDSSKSDGSGATAAAGNTAGNTGGVCLK